LIADLIHELAVEARRQFGDKLETTEATSELRRVSVQEFSELLHDLAVEARKAMNRAKEQDYFSSSASWDLTI